MDIPLKLYPTLPLPAEASSSRPCLSAVLVDLGHPCPRACRSEGEELGAQVRFARRRPLRDSRQYSALVVIDTTAYAGSVTRSKQLLRLINQCTNAPGIHVLKRRFGDAGHALAAAAPSPRELTFVRRDGPCPGCRRGATGTTSLAESS